MAKQALRIARQVGGQRERSQATERRHVRRILLQHRPKMGFRLTSVIGEESGGRHLDALTLGFAGACPLEGDASIEDLVEVDEDVAVGEPRTRLVRRDFEHRPHLGAGGSEVAARPFCSGPIDPHLGGDRRVRAKPGEARSRRLRLPLIEERDRKEPLGGGMSRVAIEHLSQARFRRPGAPRFQREVQRAKEGGVGNGHGAALRWLPSRRRPSAGGL